jgi:hypothetical protein
VLTPGTDWISLPALVLILSYLFLIASIVQTQRRIVRAWKSDALALAMAGIEGDGRTRLERTDWSHGSFNLFGTATDRVRIGLRKRSNGGMVFSSEALM